MWHQAVTKHCLNKLPPTDLVLEVGVSTVGQQEGTELGATFLCSLVKRSEAPAVRGVHRCLEPDEQRSDVQVAVG